MPPGTPRGKVPVRPREAALIDPSTLARDALLGALSHDDIARAVDACWRAGRFVFSGDVRALPEIGPGSPRTYGPCDRLHVERLYGASGAPGCLFIRTPALGRWDGDLDSLPVPMHAHDSAHLTVVLAGHPRFLCVRPAPDGDVLWVEPLSPGDVVLYPAGVPHTFVSDHAFDVASLQAAYHEPHTPEFALPAPDLAALPVAGPA